MENRPPRTKRIIAGGVSQPSTSVTNSDVQPQDASCPERPTTSGLRKSKFTPKLQAQPRRTTPNNSDDVGASIPNIKIAESASAQIPFGIRDDSEATRKAFESLINQATREDGASSRHRMSSSQQRFQVIFSGGDDKANAAFDPKSGCRGEGRGKALEPYSSSATTSAVAAAALEKELQVRMEGLEDEDELMDSSTHPSHRNVLASDDDGEENVKEEGQGGGRRNRRGSSKKKKKEKQPATLDYRQYYPTLLPLQPPRNETTDRTPMYGEDGRRVMPVPDDTWTQEDDNSLGSVAAALDLDPRPSSSLFTSSSLSESLHSKDQALFLVQMPIALPVTVPTPPSSAPHNLRKEQRVSGESPTSKLHSQAAPIQDLPSGFLGKLLVFKSGKVCLKIGEVLLEVKEGLEIQHRQEVAFLSIDASRDDGDSNNHDRNVNSHHHHHSSNSHHHHHQQQQQNKAQQQGKAKECVFLGDVSKRFVISPDLMQLIQDRPIPEKWIQKTKGDAPAAEEALGVGTTAVTGCDMEIEGSVIKVEDAREMEGIVAVKEEGESCSVVQESKKADKEGGEGNVSNEVVALTAMEVDEVQEEEGGKCEEKAKKKSESAGVKQEVPSPLVEEKSNAGKRRGGRSTTRKGQGASKG